jgi:hypothetical protein
MVLWSEFPTTDHEVPGSIPGSSMRIFPWKKDSHGDHGLGSLVELGFKGPPGTSYLYITIHLFGTTYLRLMGVLTSEVDCTSATTGRENHEVHKGHVVSLTKKFITRATCFDPQTGHHQYQYFQIRYCVSLLMTPLCVETCSPCNNM